MVEYIGIMIALAAGMAQTGPAPDDASLYAWCEDQGLVPMSISTKRIAVRFNEGVTAQQQEWLLDSLPGVDLERRWEKLDSENLAIVGLREGIEAYGTLNAVAVLNAASEVAFAAPGVESKDGYPAVMTDQFYVDFEAPAPVERLNALNEENGVEISRVKEYPKIGRVAYWLRVTKDAELDAGHLAMRYYEELTPINAGPDLIALYDSLAASPNDTYFSSQYHLSGSNGLGVNVPSAWDTSTGDDDVVVAIIDNGVDLNFEQQGKDGHNDLTPNQWVNSDETSFTNSIDDDGNGYVDDRYGWNFIEDNEIPTSTSGASHGIQCSGVAAAATNNTIGVAGVAGGWNGNGCRIMPIMGVPAACYVVMDDLVDSINYAVENGASVISMSLGAYTYPSGLTTAILNAKEAGALCVAATHNHDQYNNMPYPACLETVVAVGALNKCETQMRKFGSNTADDNPTWTDCNPAGSGPCVPESESCDGCTRLTCWGSNHGLALDIMAPGVTIWTTEENDSYDDWFAKTSSATPQVSGAAALVISAAKTQGVTLWPSQVQAILQFTATDLSYTRNYTRGGQQYTESAGTGRDLYTGYGRLNAAAAVDLALKPRFVVYNEDGEHCASFDAAGNLTAEGGLTESAGSALLAATADNEFLIKDSEGNVVLRANTPQYHYQAEVYINGKLYEKVGSILDSGMPARSFRIKDDAGTTVALVNTQSFNDSRLEPASPYTVPSGSVLLTGRAFIAGNADRSASQGK